LRPHDKMQHMGMIGLSKAPEVTTLEVTAF